MATEPFDIKKAFDFSPTAVLKALSIALKVLAVVGVIFSIYTTVQTIRKPKSTQNITVGQGGKVVIKNETAKKNWYVFTEPYVGVSNQHKDGEIGIRIGARWEF